MLGLTTTEKLKKEEARHRYYAGVTTLQAYTIKRLRDEVNLLRGQREKSANLMADMQDELDKRRTKMEELAHMCIAYEKEVKALKKKVGK